MLCYVNLVKMDAWPLETYCCEYFYISGHLLMCLVKMTSKLNVCPDEWPYWLDIVS